VLVVKLNSKVYAAPWYMLQSLSVVLPTGATAVNVPSLSTVSVTFFSLISNSPVESELQALNESDNAATDAKIEKVRRFFAIVVINMKR
jgi:hypothetical protein